MLFGPLLPLIQWFAIGMLRHMNEQKLQGVPVADLAAAIGPHGAGSIHDAAQAQLPGQREDQRERRREVQTAPGRL